MPCSRVKQPVNYSWTAFPLNMGQVGCPEKSVTTQLRCLTSQKSEDLLRFPSDKNLECKNK